MKVLKVLRLFAVPVFLLAVLAVAMVAEAAVSFVYPGDKTWVPHSDYLILKTNSPDVTAVKISINDVAGDIMEIGSPEYRKAFRDIVIVEPTWDAEGTLSRSSPTKENSRRKR
jgi:hypothetical protein